MLMMGSKTITVEGVTVFADHADPAQFWYLPAPVSLARRDGVPQFTLIRYRPAVAGAGIQGGGFLMMEIELRLEPDVERKIISAVSRFSTGTPKLTPVPFDDGKVQIVALNIQGSGGTTATPPPPGAFVAVEAILGATKPSLGGNNLAVFSLTLSQEGSVILDQAFRLGATPVGVIYDLKYTALRPSLDVKITANFKRIYDRLNIGIDLTAGAVVYGVPVYLEAGIDMAFEKMKQDGVISVQVTNFSSAADEAEKEKWALDFFKQYLLQQWFQPTLAPVTVDRRPPTGTTPSGGGASPSGSGLASPSGGATSGAPSGGGESPHEEAMAACFVTREVWAYPFLETGGRQPARLERTVDPDIPGYDIQMTQSADSNEVTLMFLGGSTPPIVFIGDRQEALGDDRRTTVTIAAGDSLSIRANYQVSADKPGEFRLYFDFDKPRATSWSVSPPSPAYSGYLANRTNPLDSRFETSTSQPDATGLARGAEALRTWLSNALGSPRRVTVETHASYEGDDMAASLNQDLTLRRADVAVGIIGTDAQVTSVMPMGFSVARSAGRVGSPDDRYALIRGVSAGGSPVSIHGTLSRPAAPTPAAQPPAAQTPAAQPPAAPIPQQPPIGVKLAFRLQKIEQIEDKSVTLEYNRQSAEQRSYAPQGLIGLLADDLDGPPHFIEVDLDSPFFRQLDIQVEAPAVFDQIGLMKADVAIEYGRTTDPMGVKHKDISFRPGGPRQDSASFFLNPKRDLNYALMLQYHFDPLSGWDGEKLSYDLPPVSSLDRTLLVNPFRDFGFYEIQVVPGDIDPDMVDSTDVILRYEHPGHWSRDKMITIAPGSGAMSWKLRLSDPEQRWFSYRFLHRLKDGTTRESGRVSTNIPLVTVNDPFDDPLVIEFWPNYDATAIRLVIVDITFEEPGAPKKRTQQIRFQATDVDSRRVRFARIDPAQGRYTIQITILGINNSVRRLPPAALEGGIVFLGEHLARETF